MQVQHSECDPVLAQYAQILAQLTVNSARLFPGTQQSPMTSSATITCSSKAWTAFKKTACHPSRTPSLCPSPPLPLPLPFLPFPPCSLQSHVPCWSLCPPFCPSLSPFSAFMALLQSLCIYLSNPHFPPFSQIQPLYTTSLGRPDFSEDILAWALQIPPHRIIFHNICNYSSKFQYNSVFLMFYFAFI